MGEISAALQSFFPNTIKFSGISLHSLHSVLYSCITGFINSSILCNKKVINKKKINRQIPPKQRVRFELISKAVARRCSVKKVFLKILENLQENSCMGEYVSAQGQMFSCQFCKIFKNTSFCRKLSWLFLLFIKLKARQLVSHNQHPLDGAQLMALRGLIHQEVPECVNEESSTERRS